MISLRIPTPREGRAQQGVDVVGTFTQKRAREIGCFILALRLIVLASTLYPLAVKAESLAVIEEESFSASLEMESPSRFRLSIVPALVTQRIEPQAFAVENPTRLVVDLPGAPSKTAKNIPTRNALITALRTGLHADKSRLVLDIKSNIPPKFEVVAGESPNSMDVVVTIYGSGTINAVEAEDEPFVSPTPIQAAVKAEPTKPKPSPTPLATPPAKLSPAQQNPVITAPKEPAKPVSPPLETTRIEDDEFSTLERLEQEEKKLITSKELETEKIPQKSAIPGVSPKGGPSAGAKLNTGADTTTQTQSTLKGIYYQTTKSQSFSSIMFDVLGLQTYSLSQKDNAQYELRIENARLIGEHLSLPQFPPDTFRGFEVILARQEGSNLVVQIHVEEGIKLQPYIAQEKLWIKVVE